MEQKRKEQKMQREINAIMATFIVVLTIAVNWRFALVGIAGYIIKKIWDKKKLEDIKQDINDIEWDMKNHQEDKP